LGKGGSTQQNDSDYVFIPEQGQKNQLIQLQENCGSSNVMEIKECLSGQISEVN
jgi:hypothetical protein